EAEIILTGILEDKERNLIDVCEEITREQFEKMILPEVDKSMDLIHQSLENSHLTPEDIHNVLLVGGSTLIPLIQRKIIDIFGKDKVLISDPMTAVAKGASIVAKRVKTIECPNCKAENPLEAQKCFSCGENLEQVEPPDELKGGVTLFHYGIQTIGDRFEPIIEKGTPYPIDSEPVEFFTIRDNARRLKVVVYAGMDEVASKNEKQGTLWIELPPNVPKGTGVYLSLSLDSDGVWKGTKVKLVMEDGSSREVTAYASRGEKWRDMAEERLEELEKKCEERGIIETDRFQKLYNQAIEALNKNDKQRAESKIQEIENNCGKNLEVMMINSNNLQTRVLNQLASCLVAADRDREIEQLIQKLPSIADNPEFRYHKAISLVKQDRIGDALNELREIIKTKPEFEKAKKLASHLYLHQITLSIKEKDYDKLSFLLNEAFQTLPEDEEITKEISKYKDIFPIVSIKAGNREKAAKYWEEKMIKNPHDQWTIYNLALLYYWWALGAEQDYGKQEKQVRKKYIMKNGKLVDQTTSGDLEEDTKLWRKAIAYWVMIINSNNFWKEWKDFREKSTGIKINDKDIND
ncbi:MAG TPA: hypothetical protein ENI49_06135, partial [Thermoplasmatales archaeon]|nr:hypothetical protein [Thermoplasmatales archaeon]